MFSSLGVISACCALSMRETAPAVVDKQMATTERRIAI
jgi:hypothetical protein